MRLLLGIDLSTTGAKALLIDHDGSVVSSATTPLSLSTPHPLWSEQEPREWWTATTNSISQALATANASGDDVEAIGLTGQMHGTVLLDADGAILRPAILWNDGRAEREAQALERAIPDIGALAGVMPMAGLTAPKVRWIADHEPDLFQRVAMVL